MPLLEKVLEDAVKGTNPYLQNELLLNGTLSEISKRDFMNTYFISQRADNGVTPFAAPEQAVEREQFLKHFVQYIRSRGANPEQRAQLFLPQQDKDSGQIMWSASVKRNLFLLSYSMAQQFEHDQIKTLIDLQKDESKKEQDRELLAQGRLILVASANGTTATGASAQGAEIFDTYRSIDDLKPGENVATFIPSPSGEVQEIMGFGSDQQRRQAIQMTNNLMAQDLVILEEPKLNAQGNLLAKVKSGNQTLTVTNDGNYHFKFEDGPAEGKEFTLKANQLDAAFGALQQAKKEAIQVYEDLSQQKDFNPTQPPKELAKKSPTGNTAEAKPQDPAKEYLAKLLKSIGRPDAGMPQISDAPLPEGSIVSGKTGSSPYRSPSATPPQVYSAVAIRRTTKSSQVKEALPPRRAAQALAAQRKVGTSPVPGFPGATAKSTTRVQAGVPKAVSTKQKKGFTVGKAALVGNVAAVAAALGLATHGAGAKTVGYTFKIMVAFLGHPIG